LFRQNENDVDIKPVIKMEPESQTEDNSSSVNGVESNAPSLMTVKREPMLTVKREQGLIKQESQISPRKRSRKLNL
jgi:hypothetical protein